MHALERHTRILELLNERGVLRTVEAAQLFGVSGETVRRDFARLESEGLLARGHGGVIRLDALRREFPLEEREREHAEEKRRIATAAIERIAGGQTVFFDASTTVLQLARLLPDRPLRVFTNALRTALVLMERPGVRVHLLGGELSASSESCTGGEAERALEMVRLDAAFVSCRGLDANRGASDAHEEQARLKRRVVELADAVFLLADFSKAGARSNFFFAAPRRIGRWITDRMPRPLFRKAWDRGCGGVIEVAKATRQ